MRLTSEQNAAISHQGNLVLTACPGSGKTRTLTAKLIQEIEEVRGSPQAAACITYTNAAVQEIQRRVSYHFQSGDDQHFTISTIHAFCLNFVLRPFAWLAPGFQGSMQVLSRERAEFKEIADWAMAQVNYLRPTYKDYEAFASLNLDINGNLAGSGLSNEMIKRAAPHFWRRCEDLGFIDFPNVIYKTYCLLRDYPHIARSLTARFGSFLIDEFQDTTEIQVEIIKILYNQGRSRFFIVGDPFQSIFGFAGARPELIPAFVAHINARSDLSLTLNFRSNPQIVTHAERLFSRNPPMVSAGRYRTCAERPVLTRSENVTAILNEFLPKLQSAGIHLGNAAVLARNWDPLFQLSRGLRNRGIPIIGPGARPYKRSRLFAGLAEQICGYLTDPNAVQIGDLERALFFAVQEVSGIAHLELFGFKGRLLLVRLMRHAKRTSIDALALPWLDSMSEITGRLLAEADLISTEQVGLFYSSVQAMKVDMQFQRIDTSALTLSDIGMFAHGKNSLHLTTIHDAKGREFEAVAIIDVREKDIPSFYSRTAEDVLAERRLFYVGVTRAERVLYYISAPNSHGNPPSRFLGQQGVQLL